MLDRHVYVSTLDEVIADEHREGLDANTGDFI